MSYRNKTYIIFDGDEDIRYYQLMKAWKASENIDFNFYDAHDLSQLRSDSSEETVKRKLRERMANAKQVIILVGEKTKNLYRFVRWEIELAIEQELPIVVVNLNGKRRRDNERCPPLLRDEYAVHVPFNAAIIQHALNRFPTSFENRGGKTGARYYKDSVYEALGLNE